LIAPNRALNRAGRYAKDGGKISMTSGIEIHPAIKAKKEEPYLTALS